MTDSEKLFEEFRDFVASRPPEERFNPEDGHYCALARFGKQKFAKKFIEAGFYSIVIADGSGTKFVLVGGGDMVDILGGSKTMGELSKKLEGYSI